jgi:hypothetical protein
LAAALNAYNVVTDKEVFYDDLRGAGQFARFANTFAEAQFYFYRMPTFESAGLGKTSCPS